MRPLNVEARPNREAIYPELHLAFKFDYSFGSEVPINFKSSLCSHDNRKIAPLQTGAPQFPRASELRAEYQNYSDQATANFYAVMDSRALDYLQELRDNDDKGDIRLKLRGSYTVVTATIQCAKLLMGQATPVNVLTGGGRKQIAGNPLYFNDEPSQHEYSSRPNLNVLSGYDGTKFLQVEERSFEFPFEIKSSDWINDFAPEFELGRCLVVECPIPEAPEGNNHFAEKVRTAIHALQEMEAAYRDTEWNRVVECARPVFELVRDQDGITEALTKDGFTDDAIASINAAVRNLFDFASKFIHKIDKGNQLRPYIKASKEDAQLVYTLSTSVVNLVGAKLRRHSKVD